MTVLGVGAVTLWLLVMGYLTCAYLVALIPWPRYRVADESRWSMTPEDIEHAERWANRFALWSLMAFGPLVLACVLCVAVWAVVTAWADWVLDSRD